MGFRHIVEEGGSEFFALEKGKRKENTISWLLMWDDTFTKQLDEFKL